MSAAFRAVHALLTISCALSARVSVAAAQQPAPPVTPCAIRGITGEAGCATVDVAENPSRPGGRRLQLFVAIARATETPVDASPLVVLVGGPGQAGSDAGAFVTEAFGEVRRHRDVVLLDYRGTGRSNALRCRLYRTPSELGAPSLYPAASVRLCRDSLAAHADLRQYTTSRIADDIELIRHRFGWPTINVYGTSYGTRVAFALIRRYPSSIRAAVLKAVAPPTLAAPMNYARDADRAFELLVRDCDADSGCAAQFPALRATLDRVLQNARDGGVRGTTPSGDTVVVSAEALAGAVLAAMQSTSERAQIPQLLTMAAAGRTQPLAGAVLAARLGLDQLVSTGMHLSVMCSEDLARLDRRKARRGAKGTFLGASRVEMTIDACRDWTPMPVEATLRAPQRSDVPILLVSGELDPNLPPTHVDSAMGLLRNGRHVVLRGVAHGWWNVARCGAQFVAEFLEAARVGAANAACGERSSAPPFAGVSARP